MKAIKKIFEVCLLVIAGGAFVMMTGEADNFGAQLLCSIGSIAVFLTSTKLLDKMGYFNDGEGQE